MSAKNPRRIELGVVAAIIIGGGLFLKFGFEERRYQRTCAANLKQLSVAMFQYVRDYDEIYPPANGWSRVLLPYVRDKNSAIFQCPKIGDGGYAMNRFFNEVNFTQTRNSATDPLLFESTLTGESASDTGQSWPIQPRHRGCNHVGFVDGQVACQEIKPKFQSLARSQSK